MLKVNIQLCVKVLFDRESLRNIIGAIRSVYAKCQNNFYMSQCTFPMTNLFCYSKFIRVIGSIIIKFFE